LNLNGIYFHSELLVMTKVDWCQRCLKPDHLNVIRCLLRGGRGYLILIQFLSTDSPAPFSRHNDNCRNTDAPFPDRLRLWNHTHVLYSSIPVSSALTVADVGTAHPESSKSVTFHSRRSSVHLPQTSLSQMEVAVHIPSEEYLTPQTRNLSSCIGMDDEPHE
jgi:hypothetical protein